MFAVWPNFVDSAYAHEGSAAAGNLSSMMHRTCDSRISCGRPGASCDRSDEIGVTLALQGGKRRDLAFVRLVTEQSQAQRPLSLDGLPLLNHLWLDRGVATVEAAALSRKPAPDLPARLFAEGELVRLGAPRAAFHCLVCNNVDLSR